MQDIARFMELTRQGDQTLRERVEMLRRHREDVIARIGEMQKYLEKVTWKVNFFSGKLEAYEAGLQDAGKK